MSKEGNRVRRGPKFTLGELGGSLGDWGTLVPFIIGYVTIVGLSPASIFLCLGMLNIIIGIRHNLPLPLQPQKTIGSVALSQQWTPSLVISTGFGTGIIWIILGLSKKLNKIVEKIPLISVRGIQLGLGLILGWTALLFLIDNLLLGIIALSIIVLLIKVKNVPSAVITTGFGIFFVFFTGAMSITDFTLSLPMIDFRLPSIFDLLIGMVVAGIAQLILTLTNVMIATVTLLRDLFPDEPNSVDANTLAINMGVMNVTIPFLGGIPLCHGSGGLAAQYAFGARTGGSMILEGIMELILGLFFSEALLKLFTAFPISILGAMLIYTAVLLGFVAFKETEFKFIPVIIVSALICFFINISIGFIVGLVLYYVLKKVLTKCKRQEKVNTD